MQILANKGNLTNMNLFSSQVLQQDYIHGAVLNVIMTRDDKIVVFNAPSSNQNLIASIQAKSYAQLLTEDIIPLDVALTYLIGTSKKIVLNVIPLVHPLEIETNLEEIKNKNRYYIENIESILNKFPNMNFYIASTSNKLLFHMKKILGKYKIGILIFPESFGYEEADFYIFTSLLYDAKIFAEQLKRKKELMIYISSIEDITYLYNMYYKGNLPDEEKRIFNEVSYITETPDILYKLFTGSSSSL